MVHFCTKRGRRWFISAPECPRSVFGIRHFCTSHAALADTCISLPVKGLRQQAKFAMFAKVHVGIPVRQAARVCCARALP
jgi:hypothetical protein